MLLEYLEVSTELYVSSTLPVDRSLRSEKRVIATCISLDADVYVNAIGGIELYSSVQFSQNKLSLKFVKSRLSEYPQSGIEFIPALSIIDVMSHCSKSEVIQMINCDFDIVDAVAVCGSDLKM
jgi:hypothetical protein